MNLVLDDARFRRLIQRSAAFRAAVQESAQARGVDLILMAHLGMTRIAGRKLGSVTEHVVRSAACPVLTAELGAP